MGAWRLKPAGNQHTSLLTGIQQGWLSYPCCIQAYLNLHSQSCFVTWISMASGTRSHINKTAQIIVLHEAGHETNKWVGWCSSGVHFIDWLPHCECGKAQDLTTFTALHPSLFRIARALLMQRRLTNIFQAIMHTPLSQSWLSNTNHLTHFLGLTVCFLYDNNLGNLVWVAWTTRCHT